MNKEITIPKNILGSEPDNFILHVNGSIAPNFTELSIAALNLGAEVAVCIMGSNPARISVAATQIRTSTSQFGGHFSNQEFHFSLTPDLVSTHERILYFNF